MGQDAGKGERARGALPGCCPSPALSASIHLGASPLFNQALWPLVACCSSCVSQPVTTVTSSKFSHSLAQTAGSIPKDSEEIIPQSGIN